VTAKRTLSGKSSVGTLTSQLRVPANDRLQKIHNTGIALAKLRADGAIPAHTSSDGVTAKEIVDGHQVHATTYMQLFSNFLYTLSCMLVFLKLSVHFKLYVSMLGCHSCAQRALTR
jgi:hypothetical protein